jgi:hypothetical protein
MDEGVFIASPSLGPSLVAEKKVAYVIALVAALRSCFSAYELSFFLPRLQ